MSDNFGNIAEAAAAMAAASTPQEQAPAPEPASEEEGLPTAGLDSELEDTTDEEQPLEAGDSSEEDASDPLDEHETPEDEEEDDQRFTVLLNGEEREMTLSDVQEGVMLKADYTRKTQALAEQRTQVTAAQEQAQQRLNDMDGTLVAIDQMFFGTPPQQPPIELMTQDPVKYEAEKRFFEQWHASKQTLDQQRVAIGQQRQQEAQTKLAEAAQKEAQAFIKHFEVKDDVELTAKVGELRHFAAQYGFPLQETEAWIDHRVYAAFAELKALKEAAAGAKDKTRQKVKRAKTKSVSSGRGQTPRTQSEREKARQRAEQFKPGTTGYRRNDHIAAAAAAMTAKD